MKEQSTTKGFAILSIAGILAKVISLLYMPILIRIIGTEGIGIYGQTYDVFVFIYALTNTGMQTAIAKYVAELTTYGNYRDGIRTFKISRFLLLIVGTFFTVTLMLSSSFIANKFKNPDMFYGLVFLSPTILVTSLFVTYKGYFQGINRVKPVAVATVLEQFFNVPISLFFAYILMKKSVALGSAGGTVGTSLGALLALIYLVYIYNVFRVEKEAKNSHNPEAKKVSTKRIVKILIKYGFPITLSVGLQNFGNVIDVINVKSRLLYAGFSQGEANRLYGLLTQYKTLINVPMIIITSLSVVTLTVMSKAFKLKDKAKINENAKFAFRVTYAITIPSAVGLSLLSSEIYKYLYKETLGHEMLLVGSILVVLMGVVLIQNTILQAVSQFYFVLLSSMIGIVFKIVINYILVGQHDINIYGAIIGNIVCFLIIAILNQIRMTSKAKIKVPNFSLILKPLIASLYMALGISVVKYIMSIFIDITSSDTKFSVGILVLGFIVVVGVTLYAQAIVYLGGVKKKDIESLSPKVLNFMPNFIKKHLK